MTEFGRSVLLGMGSQYRCWKKIWTYNYKHHHFLCCTGIHLCGDRQLINFWLQEEHCIIGGGGELLWVNKNVNLLPFESNGHFIMETVSEACSVFNFIKQAVGGLSLLLLLVSSSPLPFSSGWPYQLATTCQHNASLGRFKIHTRSTFEFCSVRIRMNRILFR